MMRLIKNELLKLIHRPIVYISLGLMITMIAAFAALSAYSLYQKNSITDSHKYVTQQEVDDAQKYYDESDENEGKEFEKQILDRTKYCFENKISNDDPRTMMIDEYFGMNGGGEENTAEWTATLKKCIETSDYKTYYLGKKSQAEQQLASLEKGTEAYESQQAYVENFDMKIKYGVDTNRLNPLISYLELYTSNKQQIIYAKYASPRERARIDVDALSNSNKVLLYRVENNIPDIENNDEAMFLNHLAQGNILILIIMLVIGTTMFTSEFSYGTVGQMMIYPNKRYKIILSKLAVIIGLTILMQAIMYGVSVLTASLTMPTGANVFKMLFIQGDTIYSLDFYYYLFLKYLCYFGQFLLYLAIVLFFALITKHAAATIGITIPLLIITPAILSLVHTIVPTLKLWVVPFNTSNFVQYLDMSYMLPGYNLPWGIVITAATIAVLSFFGFRRFKRINI